MLIQTINPTDNVQSFLDLLNIAGGGTLNLNPVDTFFVNNNLNLYSNITINGNGATIDFGGGAYSLNILGSDSYTTGTVDVLHGDVSVTGTGTTWTSDMEGQSILIGEFWYTIETVNSTTSLDIATTFLSSDTTGATFVIATTINNIFINNLFLGNSSNAAVKVQYLNGGTFDTFIIIDSLVGLDGDDSSFISILSCSTDSCDEGMNFNNFHYGTFWNNNLVNSTNNGFTANNISNWGFEIFCIPSSGGVAMSFTNCFNNGIEDFSILNAGSHGIELVSGNEGLTFSDGAFDACLGDSIKITSTSDNSNFSTLHIDNSGGNDINIVDVTSNDTIVLGNYISGSVVDNGTGTLIRSNIGIVDN